MNIIDQKTVYAGIRSQAWAIQPNGFVPVVDTRTVVLASEPGPGDSAR